MLLPPLVGEILLYTITAEDAHAINRRRAMTTSIRARMERNPPEWPEGAQAHVGTTVIQGETLPLIVTAVHRHDVGGQVLLNGNDQFWVRDIPPGLNEGQWRRHAQRPVEVIIKTGATTGNEPEFRKDP